MITEIYENLFKPVTDKELMTRREATYKYIDQFKEEIDALGLKHSMQGTPDVDRILAHHRIYNHNVNISMPSIFRALYNRKAKYTYPGYKEQEKYVDEYLKWKAKQIDKGIVEEHRALLEKKDFGGRLGLCYELSGRYVRQHDDAELIHGQITNRFGDGKTIDHAWVEKGSQVFDPVIDQWYDIELYEAIFGAVEKNRFNDEGVLINMLKYKHWGPWDGTEPPNEEFNIRDND